MKISSLVKCALAFLFGALAATPHLASAQTTNNIFNYTNQTWAFHARAAAPASTWKDAGFTTTGWSNGFGIFATHPTENKPGHAQGVAVRTQLSTNGGGYVITYYFRTTFNYNGELNGATLLVSNLVDDGAVFYLNGVELQRVNMPEGPVNNSTYASSSIEIGNRNDTFAVPATSLVTGQNVLAVEVHQAAPFQGINNPDAVFGLALSVVLPQAGPAVITQEPASREVLVGQATSFTVGVQGTPPYTFQWYLDGQEIPGAVGSTYDISAVSGADAGVYTVSVSNELGGDISGPAFLTVLVPPPAPLHSTWKFDQTGRDLGTDWKETNYNDSAWASGQTVFANTAEANATVVSLRRTELVLTNAQGRFITYYFRREFDFFGDPSQYTLQFSNMIDDGAVFYLNGREIFRYNMPGGPIRYTTAATTANPDGEGVFILTNISSEFLIQGKNLLAVELHNQGPGSSDIVFGTDVRLVLPPPTPLTITNQPSSLTVEEGNPAELRVGVEGGRPSFQWYKAGATDTLVPGATRNFFLLDYPRISDSGDYFVIVSNAVSRLTSSVVTLTVVADTNAPALLRAIRNNAGNTVTASFSERIDPVTGTNRTNYVITTSTGTGASVNISSVVLRNGTNALITVSPALEFGTNYILTVSNLRDISPNSNLVGTANSVTIGADLVVIPMARATWSFYPYSDGRQGSNWESPTFNEIDDLGDPWAIGTSLFSGGESLEVLPAEKGTSIDVGEINALFRHTFTLAASPAGAQFVMRTAIDDGAVFYMNGTEFLRIGMPEGVPIDHTTRATRNVADAIIEGPFTIPLDLIRPGTNVLAVSLHQEQLGSEGVVFSAEVEAVFTSFANGPVSITRSPTNMTVVEGQSATFDVVAIGASNFQWRRNGQNILGATGPAYTIPFVSFADNGANFSVIVSNSTGSATSSNGTLTVIADTTSPVLLGARVLTNNPNQILVDFSERLDVASATAIANYRITNMTGQVLTITGASISNATSVVLTVSNRRTEAYVLRVSNVSDASLAKNRVAANSGATIAASANLLRYDAEWRYDVSGQSQPGNWTTAGFNDSSWSLGPGIFVGGESQNNLPVPIGTAIPTAATQPNANYFRTKFTLTNDPGNVTLTARVMVDDGAVFYINGREALRVRVPANETNTTFASGGPPTEGVWQTFTISPTNLVVGVNQVAGSLHTSSATSSDTVFGFELDLNFTGQVITNPPAAPTGLVASTNDTNRVTLSWNAVPAAARYEVRRGTQSGGPYTTINANVTTNTFIDLSIVAGNNYYYVVAAANSAGTSANSSEAIGLALAAPANPAGLVATGGANQITLTWFNAARATTYNVKRSLTSTNFVTIASASTNRYTDTNVVVGTRYFYVVSAVNSVGESANSAVSSAIATNRVDNPTNGPTLTINRTGSQLNISWTPFTQGDELQRSGNLSNWVTIANSTPFSTNIVTTTNTFFRVRR